MVRTSSAAPARQADSTSADAVSSEVRQGMRRSTAARRISNPSLMTGRPGRTASVTPFIVLITRSTPPSTIRSTTVGPGWPILPTSWGVKPARRSAAAVPAVAWMR